MLLPSLSLSSPSLCIDFLPLKRQAGGVSSRFGCFSRALWLLLLSSPRSKAARDTPQRLAAHDRPGSAAVLVSDRGLLRSRRAPAARAGGKRRHQTAGLFSGAQNGCRLGVGRPRREVVPFGDFRSLSEILFLLFSPPNF